ncbi:hypothetical protein X943_002225 [Babesia divergens]|uniref:Uncharacterized protein n=1 Tax=Babesia divergens TaxID=32595 RepID=A0AAD9GLR4_BABDI|nr:hypothetical protein X943_002225 [Babesia divergens]
MAEVLSPSSVLARADNTPTASPVEGKPSTRVFQICSKDHITAECASKKNAAEPTKDSTTATDDLPEGWVRQGNGLMLDVPITPRMRASNSTKIHEPHFNFTKDVDTPHVKQLQANLIQIDRDAVRKMRRNQGVMIKASRPSSDARNGTDCHDAVCTDA